MLTLCFIAMGWGTGVGQDRAIDTRRSTITVHVGKAGLFSAAGHEHWVETSVAAGVLNEGDRPHIEFRVESSKMQVRPDPKVDAKSQKQIQADMQEKVLESGRYPEIAFRSSRVEKQPQGEWRVEGMLTLHGVTRPVAVEVRRNGDAYVSRAILKQTDYGIKPISAAGGTVKVKDELEITFRIVAGTK